MVTPPPLNVLVEIPEEWESEVKACCQTTLAVRNQRAVCSSRRIVKPYRPQARKQLSLICKVVEYFKESCEQQQWVWQLWRGLGGYESSSESGEDGLSDGSGSSEVPFLGWRFQPTRWPLDGCRLTEGTSERWAWVSPGPNNSSIWWTRRHPAWGDCLERQRGYGHVVDYPEAKPLRQLLETGRPL